MQGVAARYVGRVLHLHALRPWEGDCTRMSMTKLKEGMRVLFREEPWKVILVSDMRAVIKNERTYEELSISNTSDLAEIVRE